MSQISVSREVMVLGDTAEARRIASELLALGYGVHWIPLAESVQQPLESAARLTTHLGRALLGLNGHAGSFELLLQGNGHVSSVLAAAMVVATGNERYYPIELYQIEPSARVLSLAQIRQQLDAIPGPDTHLVHRGERVVVMLDYGGDTSKEIVAEALSTAWRIRQEWLAEVYVFYQDLKVDTSGLEQLTRRMREQGIVFCRYADPQVAVNDEGVSLSYIEGSVQGDLLVLPEATRPRADTAQLAALLRVRVGEDGYFQDVNIRHYRPGLSMQRGIYFAGRCHMDADGFELEHDALQAVANVDALLGRGFVQAEEIIADVDTDKCIRCLTCIRTCPHAAVELVDTGEVVSACVVEVACWGCGACVANCPVRAINMVGQVLPAWIQAN